MVEEHAKPKALVSKKEEQHPATGQKPVAIFEAQVSLDNADKAPHNPDR
jgi:hypothetical protein